MTKTYIEITTNILSSVAGDSTSKILTHFTNVPAKMFLVDLRKKYFHCTISRCLRITFSKHFESKSLYIPVHICKKTLVPEA